MQAKSNKIHYFKNTDKMHPVHMANEEKSIKYASVASDNWYRIVTDIQHPIGKAA